jgi:hypothetical protein
MAALSGMSGPFSRRAPAHCERCAREVEATLPWPFWAPLRRAWLVLIFLLVGSSPLYLADMHGMLPAAIVMIFAIGPLNALAQIKPTCLECGAQVQAGARPVQKA